MPEVLGLQCLRCGALYPAELAFDRLVMGCRECATPQSVANLSVKYADRAWQGITPASFAGRVHSMWRYREFLPIEPTSAVSLGEGMTALVDCPNLARRLGIRRLYVKDESRNPTWSHKDRAMSVGISHARCSGAGIVATSSSGNEGGSMAAYAARAGCAAVVFTSAACPPTMRTLMQAYGGKVIAVPTSRDRWSLMRQCVGAFGWYPLSSFTSLPIGINPFAIEGYKTIAFEICESLDFQVPEYVIVPTCWGDGLQGIWKGFVEFARAGLTQKVPRMVAAEVFGPLSNALAKDLPFVEPTPAGDSVSISIAGGISTWQALNVLRSSGGMAQDVDDAETLAAQLELAASEGIFAEASSATPLAALKKMLAAGTVPPDATAVCVVTSTGLKDPEVTRRVLPPVPLIEPNAGALAEALRNTYGLELNR
jgi:threonine synthase